MKLIVGLGNPGPAYEKTRHNAGYMVIDRLVDRHARGVTPKARFQSGSWEVTIAGERCLMLKPATYMNRSGQAVGEAIRFYKVDPSQDLLIIVDDLYLPSGTIRLRPGGGAAGHNGLADIQRALGADTYPRLRIGIDTKPPFMDQPDYVLGRFTDEQWAAVTPAIAKAADAAEAFAAKGMQAAMNAFNAPDKPPERPKRPRPSAADPGPDPAA
jgi:peptidyl-tRNA hydrolase, PTH1 family